LARSLRHHAADLTKGSVTALNRRLLEWFEEWMGAGHAAPWMELPMSGADKLAASPLSTDNSGLSQ
jgi:hypothetical protein